MILEKINNKTLEDVKKRENIFRWAWKYNSRW